MNKKEKILTSIIGVLLVFLGLILLVDLEHFAARSETDSQTEKIPPVNEAPKPVKVKSADSLAAKNELTVLFESRILLYG